MAQAPIRFDITAHDRTRAGFESVRRNVTGITRQLGALVGVTSAMAAVTMFDRMVTESRQFADNLTDTSEALGVTATGLQELRYAARETGTEIAVLETGLRAMRRRAGEAILGNKGYADSFAAIGIGIEELQRLSPEELFRRVSDGLASVSDESARFALADRIFSEAGRQMITLLDQQSAGLEALAGQAHAAGAVLGDEMREKLAGANDEIERANDLIRVNQAVIAANLTGFSVWKSEWEVFGSEVLGNVTRNLRAAGMEITGLTEAWDKLKDFDFSGARDAWRLGFQASKESRVGLDVFGGAGGPVTGRKTHEPGTLPPKLPGTESDFEKMRERLQFELDMVGRTAREQEILNAARRAGVDVTSKQGQQIAALAGQLYDLNEAQAAVNDATMLFGDMAIDTFMLLGDSTADWDQQLQGLLKTLQRVALEALFLGEGPLAGVFGTKATGDAAGGIFGALASSFGGFKASGGPLRQGKWYVAGEHGPEPVWGGGSGAFAAGYGGMSGGVSVAVNVDARGASEISIERRIQSAVKAAEPGIVAAAQQAVAGRAAARPGYLGSRGR